MPIPTRGGDALRAFVIGEIVPHNVNASDDETSSSQQRREGIKEKPSTKARKKRAAICQRACGTATSQQQTEETRQETN